MLTDKERAALAAEAKAGGFDVAAYIADAEQEDAQSGTAKPAGPDGKGAVGFYAFQHPYMTVNEIRESMGLPSIPDGGALSGDWLAKHGGGKSTTTDGEA